MKRLIKRVSAQPDTDIDAKSFFEFLTLRTSKSVGELASDMGVSKATLSSLKTGLTKYVSQNLINVVEQKLNIKLQEYYDYLQNPSMFNDSPIVKDREIEEQIKNVDVTTFLKFLTSVTGKNNKELALAIGLQGHTFSHMGLGRIKLSARIIKALRDNLNITLDQYFEYVQTNGLENIQPQGIERKTINYSNGFDHKTFVKFLQSATGLNTVEINEQLGTGTFIRDIDAGNSSITDEMLARIEQTFGLTREDYDQYVIDPSFYDSNRARDLEIKEKLNSINHVDFLKFFLESNNLKIADITNQKGINGPYLSSVLGGNKKLSPKTINAFEQVTNKTFEQLIDEFNNLQVQQQTIADLRK